MDHQYIDENNVASLYLMGQLSAEERNRFEEHFVDCPQCLDQIELTEDFRGVLKQVAKQGAKEDDRQPHLGPQLGRRAWWGGANVWQQPRNLVYAGLCMVLALGAVFFAGAKYRRSELARSERLVEDWQSRYARERQARENLEKQLQGSGNKADLQPALMATLQPAPLFFLNVTRGSDQGSSPPVNSIAVPSMSPWIVLSLEFEKDPSFESYRARLSNREGRVLWSAERIAPPPSGAIAVGLPSSLLGKGDYVLTLDGLTSAGHYVPAAHFSFRAAVER
jgi:hypothetical protein